LSIGIALAAAADGHAWSLDRAAAGLAVRVTCRHTRRPRPQALEQIIDRDAPAAEAAEGLDAKGAYQHGAHELKPSGALMQPCVAHDAWGHEDTRTSSALALVAKGHSAMALMLSGGEGLAQESVAGCEAISRFGDEHRLSRHALAHLKERSPKGLAAGLGARQP
jgi:hypothetical protein